MTVQELIFALSTAPPDAVVIFHTGSDYTTPDDARPVLAVDSEARVKALAGTDRNYVSGDAIQFRKGFYQDAYALHLFPKGETPVYPDVVILE